MLVKFLFLLFSLYFASTNAIPKAIDVIQSAGQLDEHQLNFCNRTDLALENGLQKTALGQFLGYPCSADFYHCRWQSDGYRTYKKACRVGEFFGFCDKIRKIWKKSYNFRAKKGKNFQAHKIFAKKTKNSRNHRKFSGLVFDTTGTQNCNYDYNVKGCAITSNPGKFSQNKKANFCVCKNISPNFSFFPKKNKQI
jgi:hypothetical protein